MERGWARERAYTQLSLSEINSVLRSQHLAAATSAELITEGKSNTNYRLQFGDGSQGLLRIFQNQPVAERLDLGLARMFSAEDWMPEVYAQDEDISLQEWMPGNSLESLILGSRPDEVLRAAGGIGTALARISDAKLESAGFLKSVASNNLERLEVLIPWESAVSGLYGYLESCLSRPTIPNRELAAEVAKTMDAERSRLEKAAGPPCIVHGDFKGSNLLIEEGRLSAVLDWEYAHSGTYLLSLGQLFRHRDQLPDGFAEEFADGYCASGAQLPGDWLELAAILDIVNLADFLGRPAASDEQIRDVTRLIEKTIRSI